MQLFSWYLFIGAHLLLGVFLVGLLRRQGGPQHPIFLAYIVLELAEFAVTFTLNQLLLRSVVSVTTVRWLAVYESGASAILELGVIYALAEELILSRSSLAPALRSVLRWTGAALILAGAAGSAWVARPGIQRVMNAFEALNFSSNLLVIGVLLALLVFSRALQVPWRSLPAGIALGFGIVASVEMSASVLMSTMGRKSYLSMDLIRMSAFLLCVLVWLMYAFLPERSPATANLTLRKSEIEFWDQELQRMVRR